MIWRNLVLSKSHRRERWFFLLFWSWLQLSFSISYHPTQHYVFQVHMYPWLSTLRHFDTPFAYINIVEVIKYNFNISSISSLWINTYIQSDVDIPLREIKVRILPLLTFMNLLTCKMTNIKVIKDFFIINLKVVRGIYKLIGKE